MRYGFMRVLAFVVPAVLLLSCVEANAQTFNCASNGQRQECRIPGHGNPNDIHIVRQYSQQPCVEGRTWGRHGNSIWVDQGCRADFGYGNVAYQNGPGGYPDHDHDRYDHDRDYDHDRGYGHGPGWDQQPAYYSGSFDDGHSKCSSGQGSGRVYCQSGGAFAYANPVHVNGACVQNRTWGVSQYGLWVSNGCSGEWEIKRNGNVQGTSGYQGGPGYGGYGYGHGDHDRDHDRGYGYGPDLNQRPAYYSGSFNDGHSHCQSNPGSGPIYCQSGGAFKYANPVQVSPQCVQNRTWGVSQYGLWVANGCGGNWEIKR